MQTIAVSTLQSRVLALCGLEDTLSTDTGVTTVHMLDFLKTSCALLAAVVGERASEMYFATTGTVPTVAGTSTVALPTNFSDLLRLTWQRSASEEIDLVLATNETMRAWPLVWGDSEQIFYRLVGQTIQLFPTPDAIYTLNLHYTTGLYPASTAATFSCRDGWDQWIVLQTCCMVRARQQRDAGDMRMMLYGPDMETGGLTGAIKRQLGRDKSGVRQVRDVRASLFRGPRDPWPAG